jgi:hypothetical protein
MRALIAIILLISSTAFAAGYGGAEGKNKRGEIVVIGGDVADLLYVRKNKDVYEPSEEYKLAEECENFHLTFKGKKSFSCASGRKSPLSGTSYKITTDPKYLPCIDEPYFDKSPGEIYVCVAGCSNPRAPRIFYVSPWECG